MGLFSYLHRRFATLESAAEDAELSVEDLHKLWERYRVTIPRKRDIIIRLQTTVKGYIGPEQRKDIEELQAILAAEVTDIGTDLKDDEHLLEDLGQILYAHELKRAKVLHAKLAGSNAEARCLFHQLENLYDLVLLEAKLARMLRRPDRVLVLRHLTDQILSEGVIAQQVQKIIDEDRKTGESRMFHALVKGARIIRKLNAKESRMRQALESHYGREAGGASSYTKRWVDGVLEKLEAAFLDAEARGLIVNNPYADVQLVNDDHLISELAVEGLRSLRKPKFMEGVDLHHPLIKAFVESFRETYNDSHLFTE